MESAGARVFVAVTGVGWVGGGGVRGSGVGGSGVAGGRGASDARRSVRVDEPGAATAERAARDVAPVRPPGGASGRSRGHPRGGTPAGSEDVTAARINAVVSARCPSHVPCQTPPCRGGGAGGTSEVRTSQNPPAHTGRYPTRRRHRAAAPVCARPSRRRSACACCLPCPCRRTSAHRAAPPVPTCARCCTLD